MGDGNWCLKESMCEELENMVEELKLEDTHPFSELLKWFLNVAIKLET